MKDVLLHTSDQNRTAFTQSQSHGSAFETVLKQHLAMTEQTSTHQPTPHPSTFQPTIWAGNEFTRSAEMEELAFKTKNTAEAKETLSCLLKNKTLFERSSSSFYDATLYASHLSIQGKGEDIFKLLSKGKRSSDELRFLSEMKSVSQKIKRADISESLRSLHENGIMYGTELAQLTYDFNKFPTRCQNMTLAMSLGFFLNSQEGDVLSAQKQKAFNRLIDEFGNHYQPLRTEASVINHHVTAIGQTDFQNRLLDHIKEDPNRQISFYTQGLFSQHNGS